MNPLRLLAALHKAYMRRGGQLRNNHAVTAINTLRGGGFEVASGEYRASAERVIVAAGLGSVALGPMVGLDVPLRPQARGTTARDRAFGTASPYPPVGCGKPAKAPS